MANYSTLKAAVADVVKTNGSQAITGANLQTVLLSIINSIGGGGYIFNGVATPSTDAGTPDQNVFYIGGAGTYANFGTSVVVPPTNIAVFKYNGTWNCEQLTVENGGVFDISAYNNNTTYADLAAALGTNGANVPQSLRKGGMSVKFVCSSDNKYVQFRLMSDTFSTTVTDWQGVDDEPTAGSINLVKSGGVAGYLNVLKTQVDEIRESIQDYNGDTLYIADAYGNVVARIDNNGIESIEVIAQKHKLTDSPIPLYSDILYVTDANGNVVMQIDHNGLNVIDANYFSKVKLDWVYKVLATYGDSVTAENNGDYTYPFADVVTNWGNMIADYHKMSKQYGRGIGSQGYKWTTGVGGGGSVAWVKPSGELINRLDTFNYDNWDGETYPSGVTAEMEQQGTAIRIRGCLASWLRITKMFPASIKDTINVVLVMAHNDGYDATACSFVENSTTDTEWAASGSDYYGKIGGDYNLDSFRGAVASTLMKLQLWMPNAVVVLMTGISGQGTAGEINTAINNTSGLNKAEAIREMSELTSIPCIDTYASDGINGWNRVTYINDSIHPNSMGRKMLARTISGGLKVILPKENVLQ